MVDCKKLFGLVLGWVGHNNIGDESYKISFPKLFPQLDLQFVDPDNSSPKKADICILGGGDILNEHYVKQALAVEAKRKLVLSVCAGPRSPLLALDNFDAIYVRDNLSLEYLTKRNVLCRFMPDASLCLAGDANQGNRLVESMFRREGHELYQKKIGIVFNAHLAVKQDGLARDYIRFHNVINDLVSVIDSTPASFVFFSMSSGMPADDRVTNSTLADRCKFWRKNLVIYDRLTVQETLDLIASFDLVISTRLHSNIFCLNNAVPFLDIVHHDKNRGWNACLPRQDHVFSYWNFDVIRFKEALLVRMSEPDLYKDELRRTHQSQLSILSEEARNVRFD